MKYFRMIRWAALLSVLVVLPTISSASTILNGDFDIAGTFFVTGFSVIRWQSTTNPVHPDQATVGSSDLTGTFSALNPGDQVGIQDLHNPPEVVDGAGFPDTLFLSFMTEPTWPTLLINFIAQAPVFNPTDNCPVGPAAVGQTCTLAGSPFSLENVSGNRLHPIQSQAGFVFSGVTSDGKSIWTGNFTTHFNVPYQTELAILGAGGTVTNTYSGDFTVDTIVPEPSPLFTLGAGAGLLLLALTLKKVRRT